MSLAALTKDLVYTATHWTAFTTFTFGWSLRATGREHVPKSGPVLILSNHQSHFDPVLLGLCANRSLRFVARSTLFGNPLFQRIIRHYGAVPIDRGYGKEGLQFALDLLDRGEAVVLFPEGERTHSGEIQPMKPGVSLLLKRVRCPVIPAAIAGAYDAWPRHSWVPTPGRPLLLPSEGRAIGVAFGPAIPPEHFEQRNRDVMLAAVEAALRSVHASAERIRRKS